MTEPKFREAGAAYRSTKPSFPLARMTGDLPGGKARWGRGRAGECGGRAE